MAAGPRRGREASGRSLGRIEMSVSPGRQRRELGGGRGGPGPPPPLALVGSRAVLAAGVLAICDLSKAVDPVLGSPDVRLSVKRRDEEPQAARVGSSEP